MAFIDDRHNNLVNEDDGDSGNVQAALQWADRKKRDKPLISFGLFCLGLCFLLLLYYYGIFCRKSIESQDVLEKVLAADNTSSQLPAGARLMAKDEDIGLADFTIVAQSQQEKTKIWIWDYANEDGDYIQVFFDDKPIDSPFVLMNRPREYTVPSAGDIQINGVHNGNEKAAITYAVRFEVDGTSYFNSMQENESNHFLLMRGQ